MRKFINDPDLVVPESLAGVAAAHPRILRYDADERIVVRAGGPVEGKVAILSGGGSGHDPMHNGFVGHGMLHAACPGEIFTSPVPGQMLAAAKAIDGGAGVVYIVLNYTGDIMNFKIAAEDAADEGIEVETVVVDDDVAVQDSTWTAGRRGVGGVVMVEKIAGAACERGDDLATVADIARRVNARTRSFGIGLSGCTPPAAGKPLFELPEGEMEVGIGVHGEPGRRREPIRPANEVAKDFVDPILEDLKPAEGAKLVAMLNSMGATPPIELYILYAEIDRLMREAGVTITRTLIGEYITSLEMAGASLSVCELDDEFEALWDAPVDTVALRWGM
jgi:dihydroxyacetone kinase-like protein